MQPSSLLLRLTFGVTILMIPALLSLILWTSWIVDQLLMTTHTQSMDLITDRVVKTIQTHLLPIHTPDTHTPDTHAPETLQTMVDEWSSPTLWLWIKEADGTVMVESKQMTQAFSAFRTTLMTQPFPLWRSLPYQTAGRHWMVKTQMVSMGEKAPGQLYVAHDLTALYRQWTNALWGLAIAAFLLIPLLMGAIAVILWRSLRPLRQVNRWATYPSPMTVPANQLQQLPQEVRELALSYQQLSHRLAHTAEQQQQLRQDISHDLRTPLSLVYGYLQSLLRRANNLTDSQQTALQTAMEEAKRMGLILQDLLNQNRSDFPARSPHPEPLNLNQILATVVQWAGSLSPNQSLEIARNLPRIDLNADYAYLTQALLDAIECVAQRSQENHPILITLAETETQAIVEIHQGEVYQGEVHPGGSSRINDQHPTSENGSNTRVDSLGNQSQYHNTDLKLNNRLLLIQTLLKNIGGEISIQTSTNDRCTLQISLPKLSDDIVRQL